MPKKVVLFPDISRVKLIFYHLPARIVECLPQYIFLTLKKKETKRKEKKIYVGNLAGYDNIVCEFALSTFNLLHRVVNFSWLLYKLNVVYMKQEKYSTFYTTTYEVHTFKNNNKKRKQLRYFFVRHFFFYICLFVVQVCYNRNALTT